MAKDFTESVGFFTDIGVTAASVGKRGTIKHATAEQLGIRGSERQVSLDEGKAISEAVADVSHKRARFKGTTIIWKGEKLQKIMQLEMNKRIRVASMMVKDQVKRNLSIPVLKYTSPTTGKVKVLPESRSVPGEFPRTEHGGSGLMGNIFNEMIGPGKAVVGTTLGYGLLLETKMNRSFLRRTLLEMQPVLRQILSQRMQLNG